MKIVTTIILEVDPKVYAKSAGIPRADVREHVKVEVIGAYQSGLSDDEPDGIISMSWR